MSIAFSAASGSDAFAASRTWAHAVVAGNNRILIVGGVTNNAAGLPTGCTYGGVALTLLGSRLNNPYARWYYMLSPPVGVANVIFTFGGNGALSCGAVSYTGVDQANPFGTQVSANGNSVTPSVVVFSEDGDLVIDYMGARWGAATQAVGAGQTARINTAVQAGDDCGMGMSEEDGSTSVTMSWTRTLAQVWVIMAVPLRPYIPFLARPVEYTLNAWDLEQRILDSNGHEVPRYKIKPNNWCRIVGLESTTAEVYESNYDDPTLVYFESVTYDGEMDQVQIVTNRGDLPEVMLARLASGSTG